SFGGGGFGPPYGISSSFCWTPSNPGCGGGGGGARRGCGAAFAVGAGAFAGGPGALGGGGPAPAPGLDPDLCRTVAQMRVLARAAFDQINVVAAAANQSSFIAGSFVWFASPVVQPICQRLCVAAITRASRGHTPAGGSRYRSVSEVGRVAPALRHVN